MPPPTVSIVLTTHQPQPYLAGTVESVLAQDFGDWEMTVVDDGWPSLEQLQGVLRSVAAGDGRIRVGPRRAHGDPSGPAQARNRGIAASRGEYICFLDHDDLWRPDHLADLVETLRSVPDAVAAYGAMEVIDAAGRIIHRVDMGRCTRQSILSDRSRPAINNLMVRREAAERIGFHALSVSGDDIDFIYRLAGAGPLAYSPNATVQYRRHEQGISANPQRSARSIRRVIEHHQELARRDGDREALAWLAEGRARINRYWVQVLGRRAVDQLRRRDWAGAAGTVAFLASYDPAGTVRHALSAAARRGRRRRRAARA